MDRVVGAELEIDTPDGAEVELQVAVARVPGLQVEDRLTVLHEAGDVAPVVVGAPHDGLLHLVTLPPGRTRISYRADVRGTAQVPEVALADLSLYRRPSRYVGSDELSGFASAEFVPGAADTQLLQEVSSWVGTRLAYVPGSSGPTDGAAQTLLRGEGVCRDYAHLVIAILRALRIPARLVAVYAPGCDPMDFHAVVEAHVGGGWHVVDATALAPRSALVRIATGRDAADTAFLTTVAGSTTLESSSVRAVTVGDLPADDLDQLVVLR